MRAATTRWGCRANSFRPTCRAPGRVSSVDCTTSIRRPRVSWSPCFRQWAGVELSAENHRQLYVPEGFAHGFCVLGESALLNYLCTAEYRAEYDRAVAWNDPSIGVRWPIENGQLSDKDAAAPLLDDIPTGYLPRVAS